MNLLLLLQNLKYKTIEIFNLVYSYVINNKKESIIILVILWMILRIYNKRKRKLKKKKFKRVRLAKSKAFYNTGFKCELCFWDIIKFKIRLGDYCDKSGMHYCYLFNIKIFGIEFLRTKHIDQKGQVYKRKITFRS